MIRVKKEKILLFNSWIDKLIQQVFLVSFILDKNEIGFQFILTARFSNSPQKNKKENNLVYIFFLREFMRVKAPWNSVKQFFVWDHCNLGRIQKIYAISY